MQNKYLQDDYPILAVTTTLHQRPPFYNGAMPLAYKFFCKSLFPESIAKGHYVIAIQFQDFGCVFSYDDGDEATGVPSAAQAKDSAGTVLAEGKVSNLNPTGVGDIEIEEVHFGASQKVQFRCKSRINPDGLKTGEDQIQGHKTRDYFLIWPVDLF